ncbi:MAG TPA: hypothetical protein VG847_08630 [Chitinophagaceae bacterium]|nr:hypothetical protein [Chitinophagaceae bacterium]
MWIWWILSILVLIACAIFAYRMIISSYEFLPLDKRSLGLFPTKEKKEKEELSGHEALRNLNHKLRSVEDSNTYYQLQLTKLQERLRVLEELNISKDYQPLPPGQQIKEPEEDWKELYYEENERKEKIENELDETKQRLEEAEEELRLAAEKNLQWMQLQSDYESRLRESDSFKDQIASLEQQLAGSAEREKELEQLLLSEITIREKYVVLQKEYIELQSQSDSLNRIMVELSKKNMNLETRMAYLSELESKLAICEAEKAKLKARLENHLLG